MIEMRKCYMATGGSLRPLNCKARLYTSLFIVGQPADVCVNPLKCSGITWLHLKLFSAIQV